MTSIVQPIGLKDFSVLIRNIFDFVGIICGLVKILFMYEIFFLCTYIFQNKTFPAKECIFFYFDKKIIAYKRGHSSIRVLVYILSNRSSLWTLKFLHVKITSCPIFITALVWRKQQFAKAPHFVMTKRTWGFARTKLGGKIPRKCLTLDMSNAKGLVNGSKAREKMMGSLIASTDVMRSRLRRHSLKMVS